MNVDKTESLANANLSFATSIVNDRRLELPLSMLIVSFDQLKFEPEGKDGNEILGFPSRVNTPCHAGVEGEEILARRALALSSRRGGSNKSLRCSP